jgi:hypothetical protein
VYLLGAFEDGDIGLSSQDLGTFPNPTIKLSGGGQTFDGRTGKSTTIRPFLSSTARSPLRVLKTSEFLE